MREITVAARVESVELVTRNSLHPGMRVTVTDGPWKESGESLRYTHEFNVPPTWPVSIERSQIWVGQEVKVVLQFPEWPPVPESPSTDDRATEVCK